MANNKPKKRKRKVKKSVRIAQKFAIVRKDSVQRDSVKKDTVKSDTIRKAPAKMYRDTGTNFKIKIRRK